MEDKVYFKPGDIVELKQKLDCKPKMVVKSIAKAEMTDSGTKRPLLLGIYCFWFSFDCMYQEQKFNTKDLVHCE